jgi:hypothetical protein
MALRNNIDEVVLKVAKHSASMASELRLLMKMISDESCCNCEKNEMPMKLPSPPPRQQQPPRVNKVKGAMDIFKKQFNHHSSTAK